MIPNIIKLDEYVVYCDTDSIKLVEGYNPKVIEDYNNSVKKRIKFVSEKLGIDYKKYAPSDKDGIQHMLGLFELEKKFKFRLLDLFCVL